MDPDDLNQFGAAFIGEMTQTETLEGETPIDANASWKPVHSIRLIKLINWFKSYEEEVGGIPNPANFTSDMYRICPKLIKERQPDEDPIVRRRTQGG